MQLVKVDNAFFIKCNAYGANNNKQLLHNENGRPSVLVVKLHYHKWLHDFIKAAARCFFNLCNKKGWFDGENDSI